MASSKTLQAIVEIAGSLSPTLGKAAEEASKSLEGINLKAVAVGAGVAAAGAAIGKATIEAGKYLVDLGNSNVVDTIRIGTGATGDALDALTDDFDKISKRTNNNGGRQSGDRRLQHAPRFDWPRIAKYFKAGDPSVGHAGGRPLGGVIEESSQAFQRGTSTRPTWATLWTMCSRRHSQPVSDSLT